MTVLWLGDKVRVVNRAIVTRYEQTGKVVGLDEDLTWVNVEFDDGNVVPFFYREVEPVA